MWCGRGEASICRVSGPIGRSLFERKHSEKKTLERGRARLGWLRVKSWGEGERGRRCIDQGGGGGTKKGLGVCWARGDGYVGGWEREAGGKGTLCRTVVRRLGRGREGAGEAGRVCNKLILDSTLLHCTVRGSRGASSPWDGHT